MSEEWAKYVEDSRHICKYGTKCYQKNPQHLAKYKHPPHSKRKPGDQQNDSKRPRIQSHSPEPQKHDAQIAKEFENNEISIDHSPESNVKPPPSTLTEPTINEPLSAIGKLTPEPVKDNPEPSSISSDELLLYVNVNIDRAKLIKELFLVDMPKDFYSLWHFVSHENESGGNILKAANLEMIGAFDVLMGKLPTTQDKDKYLVHWRFFYDPPEFQAIIKSKGTSEFHMGYFRDSPTEDPVFVGSNDSSKNCIITPIAHNIFGALYSHLQAEKKKSPFTAMSHQKLMDKVKLWASENNYTLDKYDTRKRLATLSVTRTFHGAGIVVPYDKSSQLGYRPLVENDAAIKKMLAELQAAQSNEAKDKILSDLQPVITYANIAMDEYDFGTGLELGIDLFCSGLPELEATMLSTLTTAYTLLNRQTFIKILQAHQKYRRRGPNLSVLNLQ